MKNLLVALALINGIHQYATAQEHKSSVYGEVGLGFGQTLFFNNIQQELQAALGGSFDPAIGNNLMMGFYVAPERWKGLGVGARIHGTFGTPVSGDAGDDYVFNYYNLALSLKYYLFSQQFNQGLYARGSAGFGQMTTKRLNEEARRYIHQYAIGSTFTGSVGYTFPLQKSAISIEAQFEYSNRNGTVDGRGDGVQFASGQIGGNLILSF